MDKIVYIGGIGSDATQVKYVARALSAQFKKNVVAFSFGDARKNAAQIARLVPDCLVITHAAGLMLLKNTTPKEVIAIAPPMPTLPSVLLWRGVVKTMALFGSISESHERRRKIWLRQCRAAFEYLLRPQDSALLLRDISGFNAARLAVEFVNGGGKVTIGFMENDLIFPDISLHPHMELAKKYGVTMYDNILGHHDELALYPVEVLAQLGYQEHSA
jgi:hypothetical protein